MRIVQGGWRGCARRRVDGFVLVIMCWRRFSRHSSLWRGQLQRVSTSRSRRVQLTLWRFAVLWWNMTFNVVCVTDASAGRAMATRRGKGRVRHLDARLLWLQQLCAEGVVKVRSRPGEHNEADLGTKMVDLMRMTSLLKGTPLRPPMCWSSWMVAASFPEVAEATRDCHVSIWNVRNVCETSGWFWICVGAVIAILMVLSGRPSANPISDDWSRQEETDETAAWRRP